MANKPDETKKQWTDEERLQLADKLDKELDDFIAGLEKKPYTEGWPEDRWQEELEKHPFFMKKHPEPGDDLHPLYEGLQQLKYDPEENTPEELANSYKDDGNFNFKHKKYRMAIIAYTEGLKIKCNNPELNATLLNNRSAANFFLKNYRSSLRDCELALKLKPDYKKVLIRAANCAYETQHYEKCVEVCDRVLAIEKNDKEMVELRQKAAKGVKIKERDARVFEKTLRQEKEFLERVFEKTGKRFQLHDLEPILPQLQEHRVHFDEGGKRLIWPVVFMYPEFKIMDCLQAFAEDETILEHLFIVFKETHEWDKENKYQPKNLSVYFKAAKTEKFCLVNVEETLGDVLTKKEFAIHNGTPTFLIVVKKSKAEQELFTIK